MRSLYFTLLYCLLSRLYRNHLRFPCFEGGEGRAALAKKLGEDQAAYEAHMEELMEYEERQKARPGHRKRKVEEDCMSLYETV